MSFVYCLKIFILYAIYSIKAYDSFNKELVFYIDCNKGILDKSSLNTFIISYGVTLAKNNNDEDNMACSLEMPNTYLKATVNYLVDLQITITFWFKLTLMTTTVTLFSLNNNAKGFSLKYDNSVKQLQLLDKFQDKQVLKQSLNNYDWNRITLSISNSKVVFALNNIETEKICTLLPITSDYILYIGTENGNSNTVAMNGYIDNFKIYKMFFDYQSLELTQLITENYCEDNEAFVHGKCYKCSSLLNCYSCYNSTHCAVCNQGFSLTNYTNCTCQKELCLECNDDGSCNKCDEGYKINELKKCVLNDCTHLDFCVKCIDDVCSLCIRNYLIKGGKCELPSLAITGVVITFLIVVVIIWVIILVLVRPKLIT